MLRYRKPNPFMNFSFLCRSYNGRKIRFYVEEKDREMDFLLKLSGKVKAPRNLTVVVTVFKKKCHSTDKKSGEKLTECYYYSLTKIRRCNPVLK